MKKFIKLITFLITVLFSSSFAIAAGENPPLMKTDWSFKKVSLENSTEHLFKGDIKFTLKFVHLVIQ